MICTSEQPHHGSEPKTLSKPPCAPSTASRPPWASFTCWGWELGLPVLPQGSLAIRTVSRAPSTPLFTYFKPLKKVEFHSWGFITTEILSQYFPMCLELTFWRKWKYYVILSNGEVIFVHRLLLLLANRSATIWNDITWFMMESFPFFTWKTQLGTSQAEYTGNGYRMCHFCPAPAI